MTAAVPVIDRERIVAWSRSPIGHRTTVALGYVALVGTLMLLYGLLPGHSLPFSSVASTDGWVRCIDEQGSGCPLVGHPVGVQLSLASTIFYTAYLLSKIGISGETSLNLLAVACLAAGTASLWALVWSLVRSHAAGVLSALLYYGAPIVALHALLPSLYFGFAFLPVPVALAVFALQASRERPARALLLAGGSFLTGLALVYFDPYPWAVAAGVAAPAALVVGAVALVRRRWRQAVLAGCVLASVVLPGAVFNALESSSGNLVSEMPRDFYRAMGVDVAVMLVPTQTELIGDLLGSPVDGWPRTDFYGDGTNLSSSYLGVPTLLACVAGAVLLFLGRRQRPVVVGLALGGLACLILGLGPSLKVHDTAGRPVAPDGRFVVSDYLMPEDAATLTFPWDVVFDIQPFASMRATYRWHAGLRLVGAVLGACLVGLLAARNRWLALGLAVVLVLDAVPVSLWRLNDRTELQHEQVQAFEADMERAFGDDRLRAGERVLFLPADNDYLVQYVAPTFGVYAYNIAGDKEIARIRPQQPPEVVSAMTAFGAGTLDRAAVCALFADGLVDAIAFDDFNMRWDSYRWPPSEAAAEAQREANAALGLFEDPAFVADEGPLSVIVRPAENGTCAPPP
jgi:hypothetical protein